MSKKWKIFGIQTNVEWYDIKTQLKQWLRKIIYSWFFQEIICLIIASYMKLVYHTSRIKFVNHQVLFEAAKNRKPLVVCFWHNRLMMIPFVTIIPKKTYPGYNFMTLASKHGDGRFVGRVMEKFGLLSILGSSKGKRKASRGIDVKSFKQIFDGLKKGYSIGLTPDGPRGPSQKINGEVVNIARISGAGMMALSYSASRFKRLRTWDRFTIPLPFSKICFYFDEKPIYVDRNLNDDELQQVNKLLKSRMDYVQRESEKIVSR